MARRRSAKSLAKAVFVGEQDCDSALEEQLHDNYLGSLAIPSNSKVYLALCCHNMGRFDRVLELRDGPLTVADFIKEFGLKPFLPLFDRQEEADIRRGDLVTNGDEVYRVIGRREVCPFAAPRFDDFELFLETLNGKVVGFVGESDVEPVEAKETGSLNPADNVG